MLKNLQNRFRAGSRSLKATLGIYFVPIAVLPIVFISIYATRVFEDSTLSTTVTRARSEKDAFVAEIKSREDDHRDRVAAHAKSFQLISSIDRRSLSQTQNILNGYPKDVQARVYLLNGKLWAEKIHPETKSQLALFSDAARKELNRRGFTEDRFFVEEGRAVLYMIRRYIQDKNSVVGVLEESLILSDRDLSDFKVRRGVDYVILSRELEGRVASLAVNTDELKHFVTRAITQGMKADGDPVYLSLSESRYAAFLYDLGKNKGREPRWGYLAVFVSMAPIDYAVQKLRSAMLYGAVFLGLVAVFLIFVFSTKMVGPIERLVYAMKRVRTGRIEQIPPIDAPYEIEYLVHSFNEMARNISAAKRALEMKLDELNRANQEIKNTQSTLVQSAKMISLGQLVAGVAHELNNPIAFIYSNMHHLLDYVERLNRLVSQFHALEAKLSPEDRKVLKDLENEIELDYVLKDMAELTQSCLDGANRTKDIVQGLKTFSRVDESNFEVFDIQTQIESTIKLLNTEFKDRVVLHWERTELPLIEASRSGINQILMNLLSNAAQAIEGRGDIWIRLWTASTELYLEIEDNGTGMTEETVSKIFDPFFTTKKVGQGTGLGLSIIYGIIQKHRGDIRVESRKGKGTIFMVRLPLVQLVKPSPSAI